MQRVLEKMAKQLNSYDESSLMQLWQHYAARVHDFEPTKRWEEAAIALCLVQAIHWKNQLFNYHLATTAAPADKTSLPPLPDFFAAQRAHAKNMDEDDTHPRPKATVLRFPEKNGSEAAQPKKLSGDKPGSPSGLSPSAPCSGKNTEPDE